MATRKRLEGISADAFIADTDKWALDKLQKIPLLPKVIHKFYELGLDRWFYCYNMSMSVRCGPTQYKTLYEIAKESAAILDMPEPEIYLTSNPFPNAWTSGVERPYITLRSSIVDTLTDEELFHLMGHELGHIKAKHVLYRSVGAVLFPLIELVGRRTFGLGDVAAIGLLLAYEEWYRQSEITADRAGLLVSQSLDLSVDANIALTAGPTRLRHEQDRTAFMDQARAYQDATMMDELGKILIFLSRTGTYTHPMPVHRTQQLERWVLSGAFEKIMAGDYDREAAASGTSR
ncbi:MAG TPA: M48 family metallopeptidase [Fimbriimonadaceae bacterium]|nr:M48 family metallopeptidase [Fimbriimonadaceae bacterium]